jgi:NADH-quinone oxidoreductase E subunit
VSAPSAHNVAQPATFAFSAENMEKAKKIIAKYPLGRQQSAVLPLLDLAQRQHDNWVPRVAMDYIAGLLDIAPIRVYEVATFYTMFNMAPVGKWFFQICTTTPCWLRGSEDVVKTCEQKLGIHLGETTPDGQFTLREVECLGCCVNAPVIQVNDDVYEDLDAKSTASLIDACRANNPPPVGSLSGRTSSGPAQGLTTLRDVPAAGDD